MTCQVNPLSLDPKAIAASLEPGQQVQVQLMAAAGMLPTFSPRLRWLGLLTEGGLLTDLGRRVAEALDKSGT